MTEIVERIKDYKVTEKVFRKDRWWAKLDRAYNGRKLMSYSIYIWLKSNPAFEGIPKGYVIHHLDGDKTNDDPSNLAIMQKYHHIAYHWKQKEVNNEVRIRIDYKHVYPKQFYPAKEPLIRFDKKRKVYYLYFIEGAGASRTRRHISQFDGVTFTKLEQAEKVKNIIWNGAE